MLFGRHVCDFFNFDASHCVRYCLQSIEVRALIFSGLITNTYTNMYVYTNFQNLLKGASRNTFSGEIFNVV